MSTRAWRYRWLLAAGAALALTAGGAAAQAAVPTQMGIEGVLTSAGGGPAADGNYNVVFSLYKDEVGGNPVYSEGPVLVSVKNGQWTYALGSKTPLTPSVLAQLPTAWLGVKIDQDAELARKPLTSTAYALRAGVAEGVDCSGCIGAAHLDPKALEPYAKAASLSKVALSGKYSDLDGGPDLSGYAKSADLSKVAASGAYADLSGIPDLSVYAKAASLHKVAATGSYKDLADLPTLADVATTGEFKDLKNAPVVPAVGKSCGTGLVIKGFKADGTMECVLAMDPAGLPPDGIDEISNKLIWNQFTDSVPGSTNLPIPDNSPLGIGDKIDFPDIGIAQKLTVSIDLTNSDVSKVKVYLYDPNATEYVLYDGKSTGGTLATSYPDPTATVSGDLTTWIGKNPKGQWAIKVVDGAFKNNANDGQINKWSINLQTLSNKKIQIKGDLIVDGNVSFKSNAQIGGNIQTNAPQLQKFNRKYTVVLALRSGTYCPKGWESRLAKDIRSPNNYVYGNMSERGLFLGAINSPSYGQEQNYFGFNYTNNGGDSATVCWKTYDAPGGTPLNHIITYHGGGKDQCPTDQGYTWIPASETRGNNDWSYVQTTDAGTFIGYIDTWDYNCQSYDDLGGSCGRRSYQTGHASNVCFKVYGTTEDPKYQNGVFPVMFGLQDKSKCPTGWNNRPVAEWDRWDGWYYNTWQNNALYTGGMYEWWNGGNHLQQSFHNSHVAHLCYKMFPKTAQPYVTVMPLHYSATCPTGSIEMPHNVVKGWNANGYLHMSNHGLYIGGLNGWGHQDYTAGYLAWNFTDYVQNKICVKIENVEDWP